MKIPTVSNAGAWSLALLASAACSTSAPGPADAGAPSNAGTDAGGFAQPDDRDPEAPTDAGLDGGACKLNARGTLRPGQTCDACLEKACCEAHNRCAPGASGVTDTECKRFVACFQPCVDLDTAPAPDGGASPQRLCMRECVKQRPEGAADYDRFLCCANDFCGTGCSLPPPPPRPAVCGPPPGG